MIGNEMILKLDDVAVAVARNVSVDIQVASEQCQPLPDTLSTSDAEWEYYRPGAKSWSVEHQGLYIVNGKSSGLVTSAIQNEDVTFEATISLGTPNDDFLKGNVHITGISVDAAVRATAKLNVTLTGDNLPEIYP